MGREPELKRRAFNCAVAQALRLIRPPEHQTGATERAVSPTAIVDDPPGCETLDELLPFAKPFQRLTRLVELRQYPSGGDRVGKQDDDVPRLEHRDLGLEQ